MDLLNDFQDYCEERNLDFCNAFGKLANEILKKSFIIPELRKSLRSEAYLDFIRHKPCILCGSPPKSDPHHQGYRGLGQKTDDTRTVPLCRKCHREFHDLRDKDKKEELIEEMESYMVDFLTEFLKLLHLG